MIVVYILQCANGRYYIGSTNEWSRRLEEHRQGQVNATKSLLPIDVKRCIAFDSVAEARKAEHKLKQYKNKRIIEKVIESGIMPWEYNTNTGL